MVIFMRIRATTCVGSRAISVWRKFTRASRVRYTGFLALSIAALTLGCASEDPVTALEESAALSSTTDFQTSLSIDMVAVKGGVMAPMAKRVIDTGPDRPPAVLRNSDLGPIETADFHLGRYELTWQQWTAVRERATERGYDLSESGKGCGPNHPVQSVNWVDVLKWCNALSELTGLSPVYRVDGAVYREGIAIPDWDRSANGFRLPSEAEWEYAARGGMDARSTLYAGSDEADDVAWHWGNSKGADCGLWDTRGTWPVGLKAPNGLGFYDLTGNVWEWCWDARREGRRLRGGSWNDGPGGVNLGFQIQYPPDREWTFFGFRLARNLE